LRRFDRFVARIEPPQGAPGFLAEEGKHKMIKMLEPMMNEIQQEAAITR